MKAGLYSPIAHPLIEWYKEHKRDLPWREVDDPYLIWVSEIILQQTRVVQGMAYYHRFITHFPTVAALASAQLDEVLVCWQGLGYYSRARNMYAAACDIVERFGGEFPRNYRDVLSLKGVGEYTAAAICSFAYHQPYAVVDGNVYRVLSRLFGIETPIDTTQGRKLFASLAQELLDVDRPELYNQAIMDFGATLCTPRQPCCGECPLVQKCVALAADEVAKYPVKRGKVVVKARYFNYLAIRYRGDTWIVQRGMDDIWKNLYEFPLIETETEVSLPELQLTPAYQSLLPSSVGVELLSVPFEKRHLLTHRTIYARFYIVDIEAPLPELEEMKRVPIAELSRYAVSRLTQLFLECGESF